MKNSRPSMKGRTRTRSSSRKTTVDFLRQIHHHLMSQQDGYHTTFNRVSLEGSNVGSAMTHRRAGDSKGPSDGCSINVYVSNNIQGVNNSILVGSKVQMGDPGVGFSLGDLVSDSEALGRKKQEKKVKLDAFWGGWWFVGFLLCLSIVILLFLIT